MYSWAASGLAGLLQLGSVSMLRMLMSTLHTLWHGVHLSCRMSCRAVRCRAGCVRGGGGGVDVGAQKATGQAAAAAAALNPTTHTPHTPRRLLLTMQMLPSE
jgi:hypothetical protein